MPWGTRREYTASDSENPAHGGGKQQDAHPHGDKHSVVWSSLIAGGAAGAASRTLVNPLERLKSTCAKDLAGRG